MKGLPFLNPTSLYIEIGQSSLKALDGEDGLELSLERQENGRLTPLCIERLTSSLHVFLKQHNWSRRRRAVCALGARGVSLRRLTLPSAPKEDLQRLLPLQIEREFPVAPDELAWGYRTLEHQHVAGNGAPAVQEVLVAAVKKEVLQEYSAIFAKCGLIPVFTLASLARNALCSNPPGSYAILDIGRFHSELLSIENGAPQSIRVLPWGGENLTRSIEKNLAISHAEAEKVKTRATAEEGQMEKIQPALELELHTLARSLQPSWVGQKLYITGESARLTDIGTRLGKALGGKADCEPLALTSGEGRSAAITGLKRGDENGASSALILELASSRAPERAARPAQWKWAALAGLLLICSVALRYAEPLLLKSRLSRRLSEIKAYRQTLPNVERDLSFLQYLKTNQPPYLEAFFALANSAPAGTRIESLSLTRRGDLSFRASMRDSQQVVDFRSKLINSGLFSTVVVEEQNPTPDRQKIIVRITGQWRVDANQTGRQVLEKANVTTPQPMKGTNAVMPARPIVNDQ